MRFIRLDVRKINTTFTIAATAFFCRQAFIYHSAHIKYSAGEEDQYDNHLDVHVANLIHF